MNLQLLEGGGIFASCLNWKHCCCRNLGACTLAAAATSSLCHSPRSPTAAADAARRVTGSRGKKASHSWQSSLEGVAFRLPAPSVQKWALQSRGSISLSTAVWPSRLLSFVPPVPSNTLLLNFLHQILLLLEFSVLCWFVQPMHKLWLGANPGIWGPEAYSKGESNSL